MYTTREDARSYGSSSSGMLSPFNEADEEVLPGRLAAELAADPSARPAASMVRLVGMLPVRR